MINKRLEGETHRPPTIDEIAATIKLSKYFSAIDLRNTFLNIQLHEDSIKYTRFLFKQTTYVYFSLPFGLKISAGRFTRQFNERLKPLISLT